MKLLVAVAGYPHAKPMLEFAREIAEARSAETVVLTVAGDEAGRDQAETTLAAASEELSGLSVSSKSRVGKPTEQILLEAEQGDYDLLILGAQEQLQLSELLLGSVARRVVADAPISVLVVKSRRERLARILVCTSGKRYADPTVNEGLELAKSAEAGATVLLVVMPAASMFTGLGEVDQHLSELLQTDTPEARHLRRAAEAMQELGVEGELQVRQGVAADEILREAGMGDYDLIVLGGHRKRGPIRDLMLSDVTGSVLDRATRPVLVARGSSAGRWDD